MTPRAAGIAGDLCHPGAMARPCVVSLLPVLRPRPCPRSIVHLCLRKADQKLVILKQIPVEQMSKDERLAAQNECQVLKLLSHPNVIEYYENFLEDKALMIAMEYAPGGPCCPPACSWSLGRSRGCQALGSLWVKVLWSHVVLLVTILELHPQETQPVSLEETFL